MPRLVRWVGDPTPWRDPVVVKGIMTGTLPQPMVDQLTEYDRHQRICALPGSTLSVGPLDGMSRTYTFGPQRFDVEMEDADAEILFSNQWDRWQFLDVTEAPWQTDRPPVGKAGWAAIMKSFGMLTRGRKLKPQFR